MKASFLIALTLAAVSATAQTPPPNPAPADAQQEAGEPRANSSAPKGNAQAEAGEPRANASAPKPSGTSPPAAPQAAQAKPAAGKPAPGKGGNQTDRLELSTATVTGDREQPKVMYVVPWKKSDLGDLAGKPMNSLVDEILSPVDRDVFRREVRYYQTVKTDANQSGAQPPPGQGEK
jgi:hypothetical protein